MDDLLRQVQTYFFSIYGNTIVELTIFLVLVSAWFLGRHYVKSRDIKRARARIPLMIGGWGTRGKSGTERIKAALFNALGYSVFSKTTGTEAMFVSGPRFGQLTEMFLFRPYDKATIWEQGNVIRIAAALEADVFLWECMALTPAYVQILQRDWMRDDIATLTNTYPDHEDLQGPAGIDIPEVMTRFIPERSELVTTEENMVPILRATARLRETPITEIGWLHAGLPAADVLERFPYEEHPLNIALVLEIARQCGIRGDFALKEMADRVVPDLGVLKVYEPAPIRGRKLQFVSGQAANERFGFMASWRRTGFDEGEVTRDPGVWLATVVNNREDRIPRSRVFADILVRDAMADRHFLIGTNLNGFMSYLEEAWSRYASELTLWSADAESPASRLDELLTRFRIPVDRAAACLRLGGILAGIGLDAGPDKLAGLLESEATLVDFLDPLDAGTREDVLDHAALLREQIHDVEALRLAVAEAGPGAEPAVDERVRGAMRSWFFAKIVVVWDAHSTGDETIERIADALPPGVTARIMGCQNIKGTGLDFAYRWVAWDSCVQACGELLSGDPNRLEAGLRTLAQLPRFGVVCHEYLRATLDRLAEDDAVRNGPLHSRIRELEQRLEHEQEEALARQGRGARAGDEDPGVAVSSRRSIWRARLTRFGVRFLEQILDAGDAVKRRRRADQIYDDLMAQRISTREAVVLLQAITKRQKGGWLEASLRRGS